MPAIRDWSYNYVTSTTGTTITCDPPDFVQGDLLVAILSADTGSQTWTSSGWNPLFSVTNTVNLAVMYKYAGATETTATFTYTVAESSNVAIISIRDVHPTTPFNNGTGYATANFSTAKANAPTRTTNANNCLNLHLVAHSSNAVPSYIEGPVSLLFAKDGAAHSDGCGWSFQANAGTTPTVGVSCVAAAAGVLATISINPPAGGATVIPPYCAQDLCTYLNPINGTTAYNGDTAFAATATTYFGSTLNGATLVNGTASARADQGLNSYHSMGDCGSGTTNGQWSGCTLVFATANKPNVTGKNLLIHTKPYLPVDLQTTKNLTSTTAVKGVALGLCSTANSAYRVWHVTGAQTPWGANYQPLIINDSYAGPGMIQNTGTLNAASILALGFFVAGFTVSANWLFGSAWLLDTTVVAGGNSTEPLTLDGLVSVAATGHERMSVTRQGSNQVLVFQPIQFGNGGTNPIYLNLADSASEFPEQYNQDAKITNYCSVDNICGYTFYGGATDYFDLRGALFASKSKYHWKIHASHNTAATFLTDGAVIIGAGTVSLKAGMTFSGMTFKQCSEIPSAGATINGCIFDSTSAIGNFGALEVASSADMSLITNSSFTNNSSFGIRLSSTTAQTYSFDNIKFSGNTKDIYISATTGTVTINILNGGTTPTYVSAGAVVVINNIRTLLLTGLTAGSRIAVVSQNGTPTNYEDDIEIAGTSNSGTTFSYDYNWTGVETIVNIKIIHSTKGIIELNNIVLGANGVSLPIQPSTDRQYNNPV